MSPARTSPARVARACPFRTTYQVSESSPSRKTTLWGSKLRGTATSPRAGDPPGSAPRRRGSGRGGRRWLSVPAAISGAEIPQGGEGGGVLSRELHRIRGGEPLGDPLEDHLADVLAGPVAVDAYRRHDRDREPVAGQVGLDAAVVVDVGVLDPPVPYDDHPGGVVEGLLRLARRREGRDQLPARAPREQPAAEDRLGRGGDVRDVAIQDQAPADAPRRAPAGRVLVGAAVEPERVQDRRRHLGGLGAGRAVELQRAEDAPADERRDRLAGDLGQDLSEDDEVRVRVVEALSGRADERLGEGVAEQL